jgi:arginyl-tRNA synthetase
VITDQLAELVERALRSANDTGDLTLEELPPIEFDRPKRREHGDWATNVALVASRGKGNPRAGAEAIVRHLQDSDIVERVEIAGPGFLNFHLAPLWLHDVIRRATDPSGGFGRSEIGAGKRVNVEYVSANPTGPVNVVSGRHAATGDAISNLLEATGHDVTREYYINDAGRQIRLFKESLVARYLQLHGLEAEVPEEGYQGEYILGIAKTIQAEVGDAHVDASDDERMDAVGELGLQKMIEALKGSLESFGSRFDVWFSERTLHDRDEVMKSIERLRAEGYVEERDGALWFLSTRFGDDKDRVIVKSDGSPTYLASDVPYLVDKFERGFDHLIYLWGADHHGTIVRLKGAAEALGHDPSAVEIKLVQIVTLSSGGEAVKASKRAGNIVPLDELVADVGRDAARYTFLTRNMEAPLEFDIALAKEQAPENPVYYVQYAHARICSILRKASEQGLEADPQGAPLERLGGHPSEDSLMRKLASYEEMIPEAAEFRAPQRVARYVEELASNFSAFYRDCRVVSEDGELSLARLSLCLATKAVVADALGLLGVSAPERM